MVVAERPQSDRIPARRADRVGNDGGVEPDAADRSVQLFGALARIVHRTSQDAAAILRLEGLNPAQFQLLLAIGQRPGANQRELGDRFGVTGGNVSMLVSKLVAAGLVRREPHGAAFRIWLTDAGEVVVRRLEPRQREFMTGRFRGLDDAEMDTMLQLARKTLDGLPPE